MACSLSDINGFHASACSSTESSSRTFMLASLPAAVTADWRLRDAKNTVGR